MPLIDGYQKSTENEMDQETILFIFICFLDLMSVTVCALI